MFNFVIFVVILFFASTVSAQVVINEVQISPTGERFIELYNSGSSDVDLTGWYIQRKTATGSSFGSLITSTQLNGKIIKSSSYFLVSRSQLINSNVVIDSLTLTESNSIQIKNSAGEVVDSTQWGSVESGKSYQRTSSGGWIISAPTPGTTNSVSASVSSNTTVVAEVTQSQTTTAASSPTTLNVTSATTRTALVGVPISFEGQVDSGALATQFNWSFGDGATAQGALVSHTYYYSGEYTAVLDITSGGQTASGRTLVRVIAPSIVLRTGGESLSTFIVMENRGNDELDISGWQISANNNSFIIPKNMILGARKTITFASEVTKLSTPVGTTVLLRFPNGTLVTLQGEIITTPPASFISNKNIQEKIISKPTSVQYVQSSKLQTQEASVASVFSNTATSGAPHAQLKEGSSWPWYIAVAFMGAIGALGLRFVRSKSTLADEFEITEDKN